ncbi:MAG TPA: hypothetical protein PKM63_19475 [Panacibacter sp.]|nr:hypothetical protein [Panacibacter sp.]HNP46485.1 hypothetical protein [Panacibacter sp.]
MTVKILCNNKKISGKVVYNFQAASDIILVELDGDGVGEIGKDILLYWDEYIEKWCCEQTIEEKFPGVLAQLMENLATVFKDRLLYLSKNTAPAANNR